MMRYAVTISVLIAGLLFALPGFTGESHARSYCGPRDQVVKMLGKRFDETRKAIGLINQNGLVELYVSGGGSWTMVRTGVKGFSCVLASGHAWEQAPVFLNEPSS